ncbi:MAG: hypothetical protein EOO63_09795 [Hymenobacter sp.]|nr:MAG: hypothetical protein EOO63_09795 [Hymenobacter sp.]
MAKLLYLLLPLAVGLSGTHSAAAQRPPIYQPIGADDDDKYPIPLTEPLLILLPVPMSEASLNKEFKTPADRASYLADVAAQRVALEVAAKSWRLSPVRFGTKTTYDSLKTDKRANHLVLCFNYHDIAPQSSSSYALLPALKLDLIGRPAATGPLKRAYDARTLAYQLFNTSTKVVLVGSFPPWHTVFHPSDLISTVQQLQAFVTQRAQGQKPREIIRAAAEKLGQSAALLQSKTLLLAQTQVDARIPESRVRKYYPSPVLFTDQAAVEAAVAAADPRYLYLRFITSNGSRGFQLLDAASGQVLGYSSYAGIRADSFGRAIESDFTEMIKTASKK